jgi:hypothetical protein
VFEKLAIGASSIGLARVAPKTLSMILTLHQQDEVRQVRLGGFVAHSKALKARSHLGQLMSTLTWSTR